MHRLCAVEQSESFLCLQKHRLQPSASQGFATLQALALEKRLAFADQAQRKMGERGKIATGTDRTFFRNDRTDALVKHLTEHLDDLKTDTAEAKNKDVCTEQHHRPHFRFRKRVADAASVTADKIELKLAQFVGLNANISELPESSVNAVNGSVACDDIFNDISRSKNAR